MSVTVARLKKCFKLFVPPPKRTVAEWAEEFAYLPRESASEPGKLSLHRAAYQWGIASEISNPVYEKVVIKASAHTGKTLIAMATIGFYSHYDPSPCMIVCPTLEMANQWSNSRISPFFRDTPAISSLLTQNLRNSSNTLSYKRLNNGGSITFVGANSPAALASRSIRVLILDEIDRFPTDVADEGSPIDLAIKRTSTFLNRKVVMVSTPTIEGISLIEKEYDETDQRKYFVPCPHCGTYQTLEFSNIKWPEGQPREATYQCSQCPEPILERHRANMIRQGEWRATNPNPTDPKAVGFFVWQAYSPWSSFGEIAAAFLIAKHKGPEYLKTFINTYLGEVWREPDADKINTSDMSNRRESYKTFAPLGVGAITCGVDVQQDRLELSTIGHGKYNHIWLLDHKVIFGNPANIEDTCWKELDTYLGATYLHESGNLLPITATYIDSGYLTNVVYAFTKPRQTRKIFASKGKADGEAASKKYTQNNNAKAKLFMVGTNSAKDILHNRLTVQTAAQAGYVHFPLRDDIDDSYFKGLLSERLVIRIYHGVKKRVWEKRTSATRNENLDTFIYALCAYMVLKTDNINTIVDELNDNPVAYDLPENVDDHTPTTPKLQSTTPKPQKKTTLSGIFTPGRPLF